MVIIIKQIIKEEILRKILLVCLIALLAVSAFAGGSGEKAAKCSDMPKEITVAIPALPATMEPGKGSGINVPRIHECIRQPYCN